MRPRRALTILARKQKALSVAFTKEESAETAAETHLPDRPIPPHPNLVTAAGLQLLEKLLSEAREGYAEAQKIDDVNERRRRSAPFLRDIRYYSERVSTATVQPEPAAADRVVFGSRVTFLRDDGREQTFRIVGEDEADPKAGTISYVSPVARALMGKQVGDVAKLGEHEIEIEAIA